ncbi:MAG: hypothetical protein HYX92_15795 [Chloroflexi bacterium]|nr:hypothetical protein [Chloroflexota bacterium]
MAEPVYEVVWPLGRRKEEGERPEEVKGASEERTTNQVEEERGKAGRRPYADLEEWLRSLGATSASHDEN